MQYIYFGSIFTAMIVFLIMSLFLFLQRKRGERSRTILSGMTFLSVINYVGLIIYFFIDPEYVSETIMDVPFLLLGLFVMTIYFIYPIEVISPGWITGKRLLKLYLPVIGLFLLYHATKWLGIEYTSYKTPTELIQDIGSFQAIFRIILLLLFFLPALLLYFVPYTRKYNNTDHKWMRGYITAACTNIVAYLFVNMYDTYLSCSLYVAISLLCSLYFTYQELYVRLIRQPICSSAHNKYKSETQPVIQIKRESEPRLNTPETINTKESDLFERLENYINSTQGWEDPDLSIEKIISKLYTNRTALLKAIKLNGYNGYPAYINEKRVTEFIQIIKQEGGCNYQQTFFDVGFRSKTSALRNFKDITGMIPSEYFPKNINSE